MAANLKGFGEAVLNDNSIENNDNKVSVNEKIKNLNGAVDNTGLELSSFVFLYFILIFRLIMK